MHREQKGFTLIEILLVVAAIAILAGIVIVAINPAKQLAATRDASRNSAVTTVLDGVSQLLVAGVALPTTIPTGTCDTTGATATQKICRITSPTGTAVTCPVGGVDLGALVPTYLADLPIDPSSVADTTYTGYFITKTATGRITVCGKAETAGTTVSVTR